MFKTHFDFSRSPILGDGSLLNTVFAKLLLMSRNSVNLFILSLRAHAKQSLDGLETGSFKLIATARVYPDIHRGASQ